VIECAIVGGMGNKTTFKRLRQSQPLESERPQSPLIVRAWYRGGVGLVECDNGRIAKHGARQSSIKLLFSN